MSPKGETPCPYGRNLRAYATRAMFRIKDSVGLAQAKEEPLEDFEFAADRCVSG